jgi:hypothetical protein
MDHDYRITHANVARINAAVGFQIVRRGLR